MTSDQTKKPWGGRFTAPTDEFVEQFTQSVSFDKRLAHYDIAGSIAHAKMLAKTKIISKKESDEIITGLKKIEEEVASDQFKWSASLEDVHMNIESALVNVLARQEKNCIPRVRETIRLQQICDFICVTR